MTRLCSEQVAVRSLCSVVVAAGFVLAAGCQGSKPPAPPAPPAVTVVVSRKMTLPIEVNPIATTRALEDVTIRARVKGFLHEKHFEYGQNVKKGQLLLVIEEEPYKIALEQAKATLSAAEAGLAKARASRQPEISKAKLALDQAQLTLDQIEERRERSLLQRKAASQDDYDKAEAQRKKSLAQVEADSADFEQAKSDYDINIAKARSDVEEAKAKVDDAQLNLSYCRMFAPINGRIGELKVKVGNLVGDAQSTELVTIQQLDPMGIDIRPAARYLPVATALQKTGIEIELLVEGERVHPHLAHSTFIDNAVDATTSTFLVRAEVPNPDGAILPGEYIQGTMTIGEYVDAVVVPEQSVVESQDGSQVMALDDSGAVVVVKVKPIDVVKGMRVIESGLEPGRRVIVEGIQLVRPGQKVAPEELPLENYMRETSGITSLDQRFTSKVSRVPGMDDPPNGKPASPSSNGKSATPANGKSATPAVEPTRPDATKPVSVKPAAASTAGASPK